MFQRIPNHCVIAVAISAVFILTQCAHDSTCEQKNGREEYLARIGCASDFSMLQGAPLSAQFSQIDAVKLVYDLKTGKLYYINNAKYRFHFDFCASYLTYLGDLFVFNEVEYGHSGTRRFLLANLNYYRNSNLYTLEFFSDDQITGPQIALLLDKVSNSVYFKDQLYVLSNANVGQELAQVPGARIITVDQLFGKQQYQPMVLEKSFGYLQKVGKDSFEKHAFSRNDIILTDFLPNDIPFCQGILTTAFQTPLAHVNILSHNRKTPNCAYKPAWNDSRLQQLVGKLVSYEVLPDTFYIKEASLEVAKIFWEGRSKVPKRSLRRNLTVTALLDVQQINRNSADIVGAKAANLGELDKIVLPSGGKIPVPEAAFAIPFFYYQQHIEQNGLQMLIDQVVQNDSIYNNRTLLSAHLKTLQDSIVACRLQPAFLQMLTRKLKSGAGGITEFRFRSSTNAEDIAGFTGAGLYESKTGSLVRPDKSIEKAVKKVWASLWTLRAFEERLHAHIDQNNLAMGILVHRAFGTEEANGVAITRHLYRNGYPSFTINVQKGEVSVVLPEHNETPEQLLVNYSDFLAGKNTIAVDYISHSSLNQFHPLLRDDEIQLLATYLYAIKKHFYYASGRTVLGPEFVEFAMDVEFKLDRGTRKVYVKQARPY